MSNTNTDLPDQVATSQAAQLDVLDSEGKPVKFESLLQDKTTVVVFIRHFFCGSCQDYVTQLASVRPEALDAARARLVVIGCGDWQPIQHYKEVTNLQSPIYADPTRALYRALGVTTENLATTPARQERRSYLRKGDVANALASIWRGPFKNPSLMGKQGNISQLGGEFVFQVRPGKGEGGTIGGIEGDGERMRCTYASRMQHTQDHTEVTDLMRAAGVEYP
ncbi:hypothetical protein BV22DRAFT_808796 [Leucogyrophana mollusca]|uniref:Uncharacterized protein n=1 Tax=Leucogyrophana mollusca TaxID=85980 RepID=A0ACB8B3P8_9AGAM|nr:hypothetical protein BV22DRAFT_808796 [Leucogyrophana mollusca]